MLAEISKDTRDIALLQEVNIEFKGQLQEIQSELWIIRDQMNSPNAELTKELKSFAMDLKLLHNDVRLFKKEFLYVRETTEKWMNDFGKDVANYANKVLTLEWEHKRMKIDLDEVSESLKELIRAEESDQG